MESGPAPLISVVIPTCNRPALLARCVDALVAQRSPPDQLEVIVVDDGSEQPVELPGYNGRLNLRLVRQTNAGPAKARNTGAALAAGRYLVFLDDDCLPEGDWLVKFTQAFTERPTGALFGGQVTGGDAHNVYLRVSELFVGVILRRHRPAPGGIYFFRSTNMGLERDEFLRLGGFDESFRTAEDRDFCDRWQQRGGCFVYLPSARVVHCSTLTFWSFLRQHFAYGRGAFRFHKARLERHSSPIDSVILAYYAQVLQEVVRLRGSALATRLALFLAWQTANLAGFLWQLGCYLRRR
jgi:GT2 family glycosyltransferase